MRGTLSIDDWLSLADHFEPPGRAFGLADHSPGQSWDRRFSLLESIASDASVETIHRVEAIRLLSAFGVEASESRQILGIVLEMSMPKGVDILAGYIDRTAYYINYSGKAVVWKRPDETLDAGINTFLEAARNLLAGSDSFSSQVPSGPLATGRGRMQLISLDGCRFVEDTFDNLAARTQEGQVLVSGTQLLSKLIAIDRAGPTRDGVVLTTY